jgi:hypothetical protein
MADSPTPPADKPAGLPPEAFDVTVTEFCTRQSAADSRVEMIGAFHATEQAAGRVKDSVAHFATRYAAFASQPV